MKAWPVRRCPLLLAVATIAPVVFVGNGVTAASSHARGSLDPPPDATFGDCVWSDVATIADELATMAAAVEASDLLDEVADDGPFTVFAPSNEAFDAIPDTVFNALIADPFLLESVLRVHIAAGESLTVDELVDAGQVETLGGELTFSRAPDASGTSTVRINDGDANVLCADIVTDNAVVHVIDRVLQPAGGSVGTTGSSGPGGSSIPGSSLPGSSGPASSTPR